MSVVKGVCFAGGEAFAITVAMYTLKNLDEGNWRLYYRLIPTIGVLASLIGILFLHEGPRHLLLVKDFKKGVKQCIKMIKKSKKKDPKFKNL